MHVTSQKLGFYDIILGRDILCNLGINILFKEGQIEWDGSTIPMKPPNAQIHSHYHIEDSVDLDEATDRLRTILDAKYEPADLDEVMTDSEHLTHKALFAGI